LTEGETDRAVIELHSAHAARRHLPSIQDGVILFSVEHCKPCIELWDTLQQPQFSSAPKVKVILSRVDRDDCRYMRQNNLAQFPILVLMRDGGEVKRVAGAPGSTQESISRWLQEDFLA
jgi:thioredoxin-like negative regulator of GroEL